MKALGGYFELELNKRKEYHQDAIRLNTGRNAFEYILLSNSYGKVYLPFFTCDVLLEPLIKNQIEYQFYNIDENFEPLFDYDLIQNEEVFLFTNYFGLKDSFIKSLVDKKKNLIIDNSQSFFSKPFEGIDTFYSPRKFFGVSDGAYLYTDKKLSTTFEKDMSYERFSHLLKRIDCNAESGYKDFTFNDENLSMQDIKFMSNLTEELLSSIDYEKIAYKRIQNFNLLHQKLKESNRFKFNITNFEVPMVYPYWSDNLNLKDKLVENKIYTASYWPNVENWCKINDLEYRLFNEVVYLPIDQRYGELEMKLIINIIS